jgi:hypothetical protein
VNDWAALDQLLASMASSGAIEIREEGEWLAELDSLRYELHPSGKNTLIHLWSEERNLTRRILRVAEHSSDHVILEVQRFGSAKPTRLEFLRTDSPRPAKRLTREQFRSRLRRILQERFPDSEIDSLAASPDLEHSFSGVYVRGRMHEGSQAWALIAASSNENSAAITGALTFGLLWLDWTRSHSQLRSVTGLRVFVPAGTSRSICERIAGLAQVRIEVYELDGSDGRIQKMDPADIGNLESTLIPRRDVEAALRSAEAPIRRIESMLHLSDEAGNDPGNDAGNEPSHLLSTRLVPLKNEVAIGYRGLEFARCDGEEIFFGTDDLRLRLKAESEPKMKSMLQEIESYRSAHPKGTDHSFYRSAPERWLESLIRDDPSRLDAHLDPEHLYSQVPAVAAGDRGILDLLGVTRRGRLVVIELKASEDIQLPMQALDYWLRVCRHQREGDFARYGYFRGVALDPAPPLLWLVAPGFRFHPATDTLLRYFSSEIQVCRIGLAENWREGVRVVFRQ